MKTRTKKFLAIALSAVMCGSIAVGMTACGGKQKGAKITVWVSESKGVKELTIKQIKKYNEANKDNEDLLVNAKVEGISESEAATQMITDVATGADLFCFAQDQLARLVEAKALAKPSATSVATISANNDASAVKAATAGGAVQCYPLTSDNGYFMLYDKSVVKESSLDDMTKIIADCKAADKKFSMELETSAWYLASFFFATGCKSEWSTDQDGKLTVLDDTFNSEAGLIAMAGMHELQSSGIHQSSSDAADFSKTPASAVVVSGTWAVATAKEALGDNFGAVKLPKFTVNGQSYQLGSYSGNKLMGVKPQTDPVRAAALENLALYLTNAECQLERFKEVGWGPSNKTAQNDQAVKADVALSALAAQNVYAVPQGQIDGGWWDVAKAIGEGSKKDTQKDWQDALDNYDEQCTWLRNLTEEERRAFTCIGTLKAVGDTAKTNWNTDYKMVEGPDNTWISEKAFELEAGDQFQCRQGMKWDVQFGKDGTKQNFEVTTAGTYKIKIVLTVDKDGKITAGEVSLVAAS